MLLSFTQSGRAAPPGQLVCFRDWTPTGNVKLIARASNPSPVPLKSIRSWDNCLVSRAHTRLRAACRSPRNEENRGVEWMTRFL
jgi:hypothetical protein